MHAQGWMAVAVQLALASGALAQVSITEEDMARARHQHRTPSGAELRRGPAPTAPRLEALPSPLAPSLQGGIDLEALSKQLSQRGPDMELPGEGAALLVFISFAMPEATLRRLIVQAEKGRGTLVLRGLVNGSLRETAVRVKELVGERRVAVQIDPQAFDRYSVKRTPAFVLAAGASKDMPCNAGTCAPTDNFLLVSGDVSLGYALRHMATHSPAGAPTLRRHAAVLVRRLAD